MPMGAVLKLILCRVVPFCNMEESRILPCCISETDLISLRKLLHLLPPIIAYLLHLFGIVSHEYSRRNQSIMFRQSFIFVVIHLSNYIHPVTTTKFQTRMSVDVCAIIERVLYDSKI